LEPDNAKAHNNLGCVLYANGDKNDSLKSLEKSYNIDPNSNINKLCLKILRARKAREEKEVKDCDINKIGCEIKLTSNPLILTRAVDAEVIASLQEMNSRKLNNTKDAHQILKYLMINVLL
jgi:tetratricopeptide (TPR) repeat protein